MDKLDRIHSMTFASIYPLYLAKAEKKGRSPEEVDQVISWLTGYDGEGIQAQIQKGSSFNEFFAQAPRFNPSAVKITGLICGVRIEEIEDEVYRRVRYLDKLVDELAKGKSLDKIFRS